jgi:hypothetical protein
MKKTLLVALLCAMANCLKAQNNFPSSGNVAIGTLTAGANLSFADVNTTSSAANGITWFSPAPLEYGIYRTPGSWVGPNFQQMQVKWSTGIVLNPGYEYVKSYVEVSGGGLRVTDGTLGVGTTSPISIFQVDDGCTKANIGDASGIGLNYGTSYLGFNAARSSGNWTMHADSLRNGGGLMYASIYGDLYFAPIASTGPTDQVLSDATVKSRIALRIDPSGVTHAKKVLIEVTNWPDYVFKPTYSLKPLSEVKSYIDLNHRLPEMPSEKEVAEKGVDVGEIVKLQTKKIEELTLYLIEKDKEMKDVKNEQQKQIDELRKLVGQLAKRK